MHQSTSGYDLSTAVQAAVIHEPDSGFVTISDAQFLFHADFKRTGSDLTLIGTDGQRVVVPDYFKHERLPTLLSSEGSALTGDVVEALAGPRAPGQYAQTGGAPAPSDIQPIGRVATVAGNATAVRNGVAVTLNVGDAVYKGDVVQTAGGSAIGVIFADGTTFSLTANARMVLNEFAYNSAPGSVNSAFFNLVQGSITFIAGQVAPTGDMKVGTPVSVLGIRGTAVQIDIDVNNGQTKMSVLVEPGGRVGSFNVYSLSGQLIGTVNNAGFATVVSPAGPLQASIDQVLKTPAELAQALTIVAQVVQTQAVGQAILAANPVPASPATPPAPDATPVNPTPGVDPGQQGQQQQNTGPTTQISTAGQPAVIEVKVTATSTEVVVATVVVPVIDPLQTIPIVPAVVPILQPVLPPPPAPVTVTAPAHLIEATSANPGTPTATSTLTATSDNYDLVALLSSGWTNSLDVSTGHLIFTKAGLYGTAALDTTSNTLNFTLDNVKAEPLALGDVENESFEVPLVGRESVTVTFVVEGRNDAPVINPPAELGFELTGLAGWQISGAATQVAGGTEGTHTARLESNSAQTESALETFLNIPQGSLATANASAVLGAQTTPSFGSAIAHEFLLSAGQTVTFDWEFVTTDYAPFRDFAFYTVSNSVIGLSDVFEVGDFGDSGWQTTSFIAPSAGTYFIGFGVMDAGDGEMPSYQFIDNIQTREAFALDEDASLDLTGTTFTDTDADAGDIFTATVSVAHGTLTSLATAIQLAELTSAFGDGTGTVTITGSASAVNAVVAAGVTYAPVANYNGVDQLVLEVSDNHGGSDVKEVAIAVMAVNDAPSGADRTINTLEDAHHTFSGADFGFTDLNDSPANTLLAVKITTLPAAGTLTANGVAVTAGQLVSAADIAAGLLRFTPAADANGTGYALFTFQVQDNGGTADSGADLDTTANAITVNVVAVNDAPVLDATKTPVGTSVAEDAAAPSGAMGTLVSALIDFASPAGQLDNVSDADAGALTGIAITAADSANGSWFYSTNGGGTWTALDSVSDSAARLLAADADNRLYFQPATNYDGQANVTFRAWDQTSGADGGTANTTINGGGTAFSIATDTATFDVTVVNDAPTSSNDLVATSEDAPIILGLGDFGTYADVEGSALAAVRITTLESNGAVQYDATGGGAWGDVSLNQQISASDISAGRLRFVPDSNENGTPYTTIGFQVSDGTGFSVSAYTLTVNVNAVNDAPLATNLSAPESYAEDEPLNLTDIVVSDADSAVTVTLTLSNPAAGSLSTGTSGGVTSSYDAGTGVWTASGAVAAVNALLAGLTFNPAANFNGNFTIATSVSDGNAAALTGIKTVTGTVVNDGPTVTGTANHTISEDAAATVVTHLLTATDPEGDHITWTVVGGTQPEAVDYSFNIDNFRIYRNATDPTGSLLFQDTFTNGIAPGVPDPTLTFADGVTVATYGVSGTFTESNGNAVLDTQSGHAAPISAVGTGGTLAGQSATLLTNSSTDPATGLKKQNSFIVEGLFDLLIPDDLREGYGIRLTDRSGNLAAELGNDTLELLVRKGANGNIQVVFRDIDFTGGVVTRIDGFEFVPTASETQIVLRLSHAVDSASIVASFDFVDGLGAVTRTITLTQPGQLFTGEDWTRAGFFANAPTPTDSFLTGSYGTLAIDQAGAWTYGLLNNSLAVQALGATDIVHDIFTVKAADGNGGFVDQIIDVTVNGTNDAPTLAGDLSISVSNGGSIVLTEEDISAHDADVTDLLTFTVTDQVRGLVVVNDPVLLDGAGNLTFTRQQLLDGKVIFVHDGSGGSQASFKISISDGLTTTAAATVLAAVPTIRVVVQSTAGFDFNNGEPIEQMGAGTIQAGATAEQYTIINVAANFKFVVEGTGFSFMGNSPPTDVTGGVIHAMHVFRNSDNAALFDLIGNIGAAAWHDAVVAAAGGDHTLIEAMSRNWTFSFAGNTGSDIEVIAGDGNDFFRVSGGNDLFGGESGFDRANYTHATGAIDVQLANGIVTKFTDGLGSTVAGTDTLRSIELITGTQFNDTFNASGFNKDSTNAGSTQGGNAIANVAGTLNEFEGRGGNDVIVGNGSTRVSYGHATAGVIVTFTSWVNGQGASGLALGDISVGHDTFTGVSAARGSSFADEFHGSNNPFGTIEIFEGRGGNDTIEGGGGFDRAAYQFDDAGTDIGIEVHLAAGTVTGGINTGTDQLASIEAITGTEFDDQFNAFGFTTTAANGPNVADALDSLGNVTNFNEFEGRGGNDIVNGNGNTRVTYTNALAGVTIDLSSGQSFGTTQFHLLLDPDVDPANVGTDTLDGGVAHARGSEFNDIITGNASNNTLEGQGGNDVVNGGVGNDRLTGGTGADRFVYSIGYGVDTITDFNKTQGDRIDLRGVSGATSFGSLNIFQSNTPGNEANTIISFGSGQNLILQNFTFSNLTASDFIFAGQVSVTVHTSDGYNFGTLYDDIAGTNSALTQHDPTHYILTNPSSGLIFSLINGDGSGFDVDANHNPIGNGGKVNVIAIYDSSYNLLAASNGWNFNLGDFLTAAQAYAAVIPDTSGLDAIFANASYNAVGNFLGSNWIDEPSNFGGDTFLSGVGNDVFNGLTNFYGDYNFGDTVDYSRAASGVTVSLALQGTSQATGGAGNDWLINIENLRGSAHNDALTGDDDGNVLEGGLGNDSLDGGSGGPDTASYEHATAGVTVSLMLQGAAQATGGAGSDTLINIENLRGSAHGDTLTGSGSSTLEGGLGDDHLVGQSGESDTASYEHAASGVTVSLANAGPQNTIGAGNDTLTNITNLLGSRFADHLTGDGNDNTLGGGFGGADVLMGGGGADTFIFNGGTMTINDFTGAQGDKIDLWVPVTASQLDAFIAASTGDTIDFGNFTTLTLQNVPHINESGLSSSDFILHP